MVGFEELEPEGDAISIIEMGISNFKQFNIESYLQIQEVKSDIETINLALATIDIKNCMVEDIYYNAVDIRNFFQNTTALTIVKMLMC